MPTLTTTEAAQRLGITPRAVSLLLRRGVVSGEKRGRDWLVEAVEVERYRVTRKPVGRPHRIAKEGAGSCQE